MNSPIDDFKYLKNLDNIFDISYFTIFEKYMKYNLSGADKKIEIESTDQEGLLSKMNGGLPMPGNIYTFIYGGPDIIIETSKVSKQYTDLIPLVFCMRVKKDQFSGINLNTLPVKERLLFLQAFYELFNDFLSKDVELLAQNDKLALNKRFLSYISSGNGKKMIEVFNKKYSANFNFGFRNYSMSKIKNLRMVEYQEWKYIPFYDPRNAFRKLSQGQIHKLYHDKNK